MATNLSNLKVTKATTLALAKAKELNLRVTSAYRSSEESVRVGGYATDDHTKGLAIDFAGSKENMDKLAKWARASGMYRWIGWQVAGHYDHVHLSWTITGATAVKPSTTVQKGSTGSIVKAIQSALGGLTVDGIFGEKTKTAVKQFQANRGLTQDGIVGNKTWSALTEGNGLFFYR